MSERFKGTGLKHKYEKSYVHEESNASLSFQASEAYKLLRTNLMFSLTESDKCHILGVTSSIGGEGKSTTAKNLAISLAETGNKVLIIDFDLRLPAVAKLFSMRTKPGISNVLADFCRWEEVIKPCEESKNLDVLVAGDVPPNPSEMLGSPKTKKVLEEISQNYNYIIVDLPPVNVVSDSLIVSKILDGVIMVVRQNYNHKKDLNEALRRLKMVEARVLGFVLNDSDVDSTKYKSKYKNKYYGGYENKKTRETPKDEIEK